MSKQKFDVFFQQVNRQVIEVTAKDLEEAARKAERIYRREGYGLPVVDGVQTAASMHKTKQP